MKLSVVFGTLNSAAAQMFEIPGRRQSLPLYGPVPEVGQNSCFLRENNRAPPSTCVAIVWCLVCCLWARDQLEKTGLPVTRNIPAAVSHVSVEGGEDTGSDPQPELTHTHSL